MNYAVVQLDDPEIFSFNTEEEWLRFAAEWHRNHHQMYAPRIWARPHKFPCLAFLAGSHNGWQHFAFVYNFYMGSS